MKIRNTIFSCIAMLAVLFTTTTPELLASSHKGVCSLLKDINCTVKEDLAIDQQILEIVTEIKSCTCQCIQITSEDFMDETGHLTKSYVITEPGKYCLGESIYFEPDTAYIPAIQILSDDVYLDLSGFELVQANTFGNVYGILIGEGLFYTNPNAVYKNIGITNGIIRNFTESGIFCYNASFDNIVDPTFLQLSFQSIALTDLDILECGDPTIGTGFGVGIAFDYADVFFRNLSELFFPVAHKNIIIDNCRVNRCNGIVAIDVNLGDNIIIRNTQANDLTDASSFGLTGAYYITSKNVQMVGCQGNNARQTNPATVGGQVGSFLQRCVNVYVQDCQFNNAYGESSGIINFNCSNSVGFVAENCQFNSARGGAGAVIIVGLHMSDSAYQRTEGNGMKFINCQFNGASVNGDRTANLLMGGFLAITLRNVVFEGCQAANITNDGPLGHVFGFWVESDASDPIPAYASLTDITFSNCVVSDVMNLRGTTAVGYFCGAAGQTRNGQQGQYRNAVFNNCIAERIYTNSTTSLCVGIYAGLNTAFIPTRQYAKEVNAFVDNCYVADVRSNSASPSARSAGIMMNAVSRPVISHNTVNDCDRGILLTGVNAITPSSLFQLASSSANALAVPPIPVDLIGTSTYATGTASQGVTTGRTVVQGFGTAFTTSMAGGTIYWGTVTGTASQTGDLVTATAPVFTRDMEGDQIAFPNGYTAFIVRYLSSTVVEVSASVPVAFVGQPFTVKRHSAFITGVDTIGQQLSVSRWQVVAAGPYTIEYGLPASAPLQTFTNTVAGRGGPVVSIAPSLATVDLTRDTFSAAPTDLNFAGGATRWQPGDTIAYNNGGGTTIGGLTNGSTYYLIVFNPGFSNYGVIEENTVSNCTVRGYVDARPNADGTSGPFGSTTTSAWIDNVAMDNGPTGLVPTYQGNYDISWNPGIPPVDEGFVGGPYPATPNKYFNLSLRP